MLMCFRKQQWTDVYTLKLSFSLIMTMYQLHHHKEDFTFGKVPAASNKSLLSLGGT